MINANELKLLAERIAQMSENHRRLSEVLKNMLGGSEQGKGNDQKMPTSAVTPPNVFPLSNFPDIKKLP